MLHQKRQHNQQGTAIFMALLVITLIVALVTLWFMQLRLSTRQTQQMLFATQARLEMQAILADAIVVLKNLKVEAKWPIVLKQTQTKTKVISGVLFDAQARLNLNNIADHDTYDAFIHLITLADPTVNPARAKQIAEGVIAWMTPIRNMTEDKLAINRLYLEASPAYLASNQAFQSVSELRMIAGVNAKLYLVLSPYLIALPAGTGMNFKSAKPLILRAFNIKEIPPIGDMSEFYLLRSYIKTQNQELVLYTLLHRKVINNKIVVGVVWERNGFNLLE